ncbi:MAG TPA: aminopeptidase [Gaiellaceae bacterium]|nr:aminopeptidase [Gaiellaceae bacterium]
MAAELERIDRYAELIVQIGANVQPGQTVEVTARIEHAHVARAVARASYRAGAAYVDVLYSDQHVRRAMIEHAADDVLSWTPPWLLQRAKHFGKENAAIVALVGDAEPELLADLPGDRVGKARMKELGEEIAQQTNEGLNNWVVTGVPSEGWASQLFGTPDVDALWELVEFCVRLDEDDPVAAWRAHVQKLGARAELLDDMQIDSLRYRGPGTDLTVGLLPESRWQGCESTSVTGINYVANMPTEEVFTTPDCRRTDGTVRSTQPLVLGGQIVKGLEVRFEHGRIVDVRAEEGAGVIEGELASDENAALLGEVALVDGTSRVGQTGRVFYETLFDENASCHVAYGSAYAEAVEGGLIDGVNVSSVHTDFMIGGPDVEIDAVLRDGTVVALLRDNVWQLDA